jgi:hypothetical protein
MSDKTEDQIREGLKLLAEDVQPPEGEAARRPRAWFLPRVTPRLGVALAGAAVCAAVGALAATGAFDGGHRAAAAPKAKLRIRGGMMIPYFPPLWVNVNRGSDGTLQSVDVRVHSYSANDTVELKVVHSTPGGGDTVVYTTQVTTGTSASSCPTGPTGHSGPTGRTGPIVECGNLGSSWTGTLVPSDWTGGCDSSGDYWISSGTVKSQTFTCDASQAGPTGQVGPTANNGPTG